MISELGSHKNLALIKKRKLWVTNIIALPLIFVACIILYFLSVPQYHWTAVNAIRSSYSAVIIPGTKILQPFQVPWNNFSGVRILFYDLLYDREGAYPYNSTLNVQLFDEAGREILSRSIPVNEIKHGQYYTLTFPGLPNSRLKHYFLQFSTDNLTNGITIASSLQAQSPNLAYFVNGEVVNETLIFDMRFSRPFVAKNYLFWIVIVTGFIWSMFLLRKTISTYLNLIPFSITVSTLILLFGLAFLILEPPLQMLDEQVHFRRVWEVSTGKIFPTIVNNELVAYLPEYIQKTFDRISLLETGDNQNPIQLHEMLIENPNDPLLLSTTPELSTGYSFFAYLLPGFFVRLGTSSVSALGLTYLARLGSLIEYVFLTGWALANARKGKYAIAVVSLLPLVLSVGTAINVDALLYGGSFLFLSSVTNIAYPSDSNTPPNWMEIFGVIIGSFSIMISKHVYIPLFALVLLIPNLRFGGRTQKFVLVTIYLLTTLLFAVGMQSMIPITSDPRIDTSEIDYRSQLASLLEHPSSFFSVIWNTLKAHFVDYYGQYSKLTGTIHELKIFGVVQAVFVLCFAWLEAGDFNKKINLIDYILILAIIFVTIVFVMLPLYLLWTPVGADIVQGIQGRYFVPIITLILLLLKPPLNLRPKCMFQLFVISTSALQLYFLWSTVLFFY